jgi:hypothetical protein
MERRDFLVSSLAASAWAAAAPGNLIGAQEPAGAPTPEYYQLRIYRLRTSQNKLVTGYLSDALVPALNRLGIKPVGVFTQSIGPETPSIYVLMPSVSAETLLNVESLLMRDEEYTKAGAAFLEAPAGDPAFVQIETRMMRALEKTPQLTVPAATAANSPRLFELRTYESPSMRDHVRKIEMMGNGETALLVQSGFWPVFYSDTLIGPRQPNLTYMIGFANLTERDKQWAALFASPEWKRLSSDPRYNFEGIVSNITNLILAPAPFSQI